MTLFSQQEEFIKPQDRMAAGYMPLVGHLEELRRRLIRIIIALAGGSVGCYLFIDQIMAWLTAPAGKLYYLSPAEAFFSYCKVACITGLLVTLPWVLYEVWAFLLPALTATERFALRLLVPSSALLFYLGLGFAYKWVLPAAMHFFGSFAGTDLQPMFSLGQYVSFVLSLVVPFGLVFEMPLFMLVLASLNIISSRRLATWRKFMVVLAFIAGGIISPTPDILGQVLLAVPIILLYETSLAIIRWVLHK